MAEEVRDLEGKSVFTGRLTVSGDGRTLTWIERLVGVDESQTYVYDRQ